MAIFTKARTFLITITGLTIALLSSHSALAHHAFTAQYDINKPVMLEGVVVKVEWLNPHAYFYIDVLDEESGEVTTWACELGSPVSLQRQGWSRNSLTLGEFLSVEGSRARDGSPSLNTSSVVVESSGQQLFSRRQ